MFRNFLCLSSGEVVGQGSSYIYYKCRYNVFTDIIIVLLLLLLLLVIIIVNCLTLVLLFGWFFFCFLRLCIYTPCTRGILVVGFWFRCIQELHALCCELCLANCTSLRCCERHRQLNAEWPVSVVLYRCNPTTEWKGKCLLLSACVDLCTGRKSRMMERERITNER
jgi:uncharacterized integral membrane protein